MCNWNTEFYGISIRYQKQLVQIKTDDVLIKYLSKKETDLELGKQVKQTYKKIFKADLNITAESLAVEILIHVYLDEISKGVKKLGSMLPQKIVHELNTICNKIGDRTEIIDSGEAEIDPNRRIFDSLAPYRKIFHLFLF